MLPWPPGLSPGISNKIVDKKKSKHLYYWVFFLDGLVNLYIDNIEHMFYNLSNSNMLKLLKYRRIWNTIKKNMFGGATYEYT